MTSKQAKLRRAAQVAAAAAYISLMLGTAHAADSITCVGSDCVVTKAGVDTVKDFRLPFGFPTRQPQKSAPAHLVLAADTVTVCQYDRYAHQTVCVTEGSDNE